MPPSAPLILRLLTRLNSLAAPRRAQRRKFAELLVERKISNETFAAGFRWRAGITLPDVIKPMLATSAKSLPTGPEWTYEVKWDGYRTLAVKEGESVRLISRNLNNVSKQYPGVVQAVARIRSNRATLDGELVAVDEKGRPSFQALQHRASTPLPVVYYAFDLLNLDGQDLTKRPLEERRKKLVRVVGKSGVLLSQPLPGSVEQITEALRELGLEGVVAKRRGSRYYPGQRSKDWLKVRFGLRQEFVIGGYKPADPSFESILVGYYDKRRLYYAGKVRAGFTPHLRADVFARIKPLEQSTCPFVNLPNSQAKTSRWGEGVTAEDMNTLRWVKPRVVAEVSFVEWTRDGNLRHAAFVGLREDKRAADVRRDT